MPKGILGKKIETLRLFKEDGRSIAVTAIGAGPCWILQVKDKPKESYTALQLGYQDMPAGRTPKPQKEFFSKIKVTPQKFIREIRSDKVENFKVGDKLTVDIFAEGDFVDITGISKGKGFQGGMKRWHWSGGPATHGSMSHRRPGSIGASAYPSRVLKGTHMPGRMGQATVTIQNLEVIKVDKEQNMILVKGAVPGHQNSFLIIKKSKKKKRAVKPVAEEKPEVKKPAKKEEKPQVKAEDKTTKKDAKKEEKPKTTKDKPA